MKRVGFFECPRCMEERLFVLYAPPWDPNMASCPECGYVFGYMICSETIVDELGRVTAVAVTRPVLPPEVLAAGIKRYQDGVAEDLLRRHGGPHVVQAMRRRREGLASDDPATRARLLGMVDVTRRG